MGFWNNLRRCGRRAFPTLAFVALLMKVAAPPGFMFGPEPLYGHSGPAFALVICTGHGPLGLGKDKSGDSRRRSDSPCAYAGHAAAPTPALGPELQQSEIVQAADPATVIADLAPGRGLAAPPPPSRGPPHSLI